MHAHGKVNGVLLPGRSGIQGAPALLKQQNHAGYFLAIVV